MNQDEDLIFKIKFVLLALSVAFFILFPTLFFTNIISPYLVHVESSENPPLHRSESIADNRTVDVYDPNKISYDSATRTNTPPNSLYGHLSYSEVDSNQLILISSYGVAEYQRFEFLTSDAGKALMRMIYAARNDGFWIVPVSGFRTVERQENLYQRQIDKRGSAREAAKLSAPPGYSEHHTGYAIDLTDGNLPREDITYAFSETQAYDWLIHNAYTFGFELSFPPENSSGVNFEPWHWRFIGSPKAKEVFTSATN